MRHDQLHRTVGDGEAAVNTVVDNWSSRKVGHRILQDGNEAVAVFTSVVRQRCASDLRKCREQIRLPNKVTELATGRDDAFRPADKERYSMPAFIDVSLAASERGVAVMAEVVDAAASMIFPDRCHL